MCSNCSGDDPKPESFALFDVSSPGGADRFAGTASGKRKRYRTGRVCAEFARAALTQAIQRVRGSKSHVRIIGSVDQQSFVNLNLGGSVGEYMANSGNPRDVAKPVEIRVSSDAIIEVFANCGSDQNMPNARGVSEREYFSAWEESYAERVDSRRTLTGFRRTRRLKHLVAYGALVAVAAVAIWCAAS